MTLIGIQQDDYVVWGIDLSGSMQTKDCKVGRYNVEQTGEQGEIQVSRLDYVRTRIIQAFQDAVKVGSAPKRMDVIGFGTMLQSPGGELTDKNVGSLVGQLQAADGNTRTHELLQEVFVRARASQAKRTLLLICTDGAPDDPDAFAHLLRGKREETPIEVYVLHVGENWSDDPFHDAPGIHLHALKDVEIGTSGVGQAADKPQQPSAADQQPAAADHPVVPAAVEAQPEAAEFAPHADVAPHRGRRGR